MVRARLFSPLGATRGTSVDVEDVATVGRDPDHALVIDDGLISKDHARIAFDRTWGGFSLEDLGSMNGTALDGVPVIGRERLDDLHVITFAGRHEFVFQALEATEAKPSPALERPAAAAAARPPDAPIEPAARPQALRRPNDPVTEPLQLTRQGQEPVALPQALADVLDPAGAVERTQSHELPPPVPGVLGGSEASAASAEAPAAPAEAPAAPAEAPAAPAEAPAAPVEVPAASADGASPTLAEDESPPLPGSPSPYVLEVRFHEGRPERFPLRYGDNLVGRINVAEVQLKNEHISRRHAVLSVGSTIVLRDRGSNNHTFLGGERVEGEARVRIGDLMRFGPLEARVIRLDRES